MLASATVTLAGLLALISSIGMGMLTSESIQVGLYDFGLGALNTAKKGVPKWLAATGDADTPVEYLTDGPVTDAILAATAAAAELKAIAAPRLEVLGALERTGSELEQMSHNLALAAAIAWSSMERAPWRVRYAQRLEPPPSASKSWLWTRAAVVRDTLEGNRSRLRVGDLDEVLIAYNSSRLQTEVNRLRRSVPNSPIIPLHVSANGQLQLEETLPTIAEEFLRVEVALRNWTGLGKFLDYTLKRELVVEPRLAAIRSTLKHERSLTAYREYSAWEADRTAKAARAGAHLRDRPHEEAAFLDFLTKLQGWGYDFPEDIGRKVPGLTRLTRRDLDRRWAVEVFRRQPNRWITLFVVSVFLGLVGFGVSAVYSLAFIVNMGILGTARNLVGIVYVRSEGALRRARIEERQKCLALSDNGSLSPAHLLQDRDVGAHTD
jgi:hypothetical protein